MTSLFTDKSGQAPDSEEVVREFKKRLSGMSGGKR
ncbi:MAG: protease modulator HflK N-terminal domain-containing protein [Holophagales bacterium]|nr:protease modulator HflK N-terminal domain-containing protein [Holophagales bacterium]